MQSKRAWSTLGLVALVFVVSDFSIPWLYKVEFPSLLGVAVGMLFGQINLIAVWGTLSASPLVIRLPGSVLLIGAAYGAINGGAFLLTPPHNQGSSAPDLFVMLLVALWASQLLLFVVGKYNGWR